MACHWTELPPPMFGRPKISQRVSPPMDEFKQLMDSRIWDMYHIEVEHLCAKNQDGSKKTYEQMFYHVPVRRSQIGQVERERERVPPRNDPRLPGSLGSVVSGWTQADTRCTEYAEQSPASRRTPDTTGARSSRLCPTRIQGFPVQISNWCKKLKIDYVRTPFPMSAPRGAKMDGV